MISRCCCFQNADINATLAIMQKTLLQQIQWDATSCKSSSEQATNATSQCPSSLKEACQGHRIFKRVEHDQSCAAQEEKREQGGDGQGEKERLEKLCV